MCDQDLFSQDRNQDQHLVSKTETKTETTVVKIETKTKTSVVNTEIRTKTSVVKTDIVHNLRVSLNTAQTSRIPHGSISHFSRQHYNKDLCFKQFITSY